MAYRMGRKLGATNRPAFYTYTTEIERKEYVKWVKKAYKQDMKLAVWYGDQLFGKAVQPVSGENGEPLIPPSFSTEERAKLLSLLNK